MSAEIERMGWIRETRNGCHKSERRAEGAGDYPERRLQDPPGDSTIINTESDFRPPLPKYSRFPFKSERVV